jgi:hypothetical protein
MVYMVYRCNESTSLCLEIHKLGKASDKVSRVAILLEYPLFFLFGLTVLTIQQPCCLLISLKIILAHDKHQILLSLCYRKQL